MRASCAPRRPPSPRRAAGGASAAPAPDEPARRKAALALLHRLELRAGDGALGVLYGDGALRVALLGLDGGRVVEEAACVSTAAAGGTALAVVGDRFAVGAADGSCAVVKARLCAVLGQAAIAREGGIAPLVELVRDGEGRAKCRARLVDLEMSDEHTALYVAAHIGHTAIVRALLAARADASLQPLVRAEHLEGECARVEEKLADLEEYAPRNSGAILRNSL